VSLYLGSLATTLGRWAEGERHLDAALKACQRLGAMPLVLSTQVRQARLLLRRGQPGDAGRAETIVKEVRATAEERGLTPIFAELDAVLPRAGG